LELTPDQRKALVALDKEMAEKLDQVLSEEQRKLAASNDAGDGGGADKPGQIVPASMLARLKLTEAQQKQVSELQAQADEKANQVLNEKQREEFAKAKTRNPGPPRPPGPPGGGMGPAGGGGIFRATRYPADYTGLAGKELKPSQTIEEMLAAASGSK
jgi:hypothetical protein